MVPDLRASGSLSESEQRRLRAIVEARSLELSRESLPEQVLRRIAERTDIIHVLDARESTYAQCTVGSDALECWVLGDELVEPMLTFIEQLSGERSLDRRIWRRASLPGDPPLEGMRLRREIIRMDADLTSFAGAERPGGITKRPFRPGFDEDRWIALNALAFESHPEQSEVGHHELSARMSESWFDPEGFLLVEDDEGLAGFCWTKVHDDPWGSSGEIYVIGVAPRCAGRGIGRFAVAAGLEHLRSVGITDAFLYVEAGNDVAVSLYRSLGFEERWRDQLWETTG